MLPRDFSQRPLVSTPPASVTALDTGRSALTDLGLGRGLLRKAGAAFGEQLRPSSTSLATDRIIHAIDGLRKVLRFRMRIKRVPRGRSAH